jgi:hypothetical protein
MIACCVRCSRCSCCGELSALPAGELAARLAEAYRVIGELTARAELLAARAEDLAAQNERLAARVEDLERQVRRDSSTSSRPPSPDSAYKKKGADRSLRERGKRRPGKQPGDPGATMKLVDDPDERVFCPPAACRGCGTGLERVPVAAQCRHQVTDIQSAPAPVVTGYVAQAKECPCCGVVTEGELPPDVRARASFGPETCAHATNLAAGHHIPIWRSAVLLCQLAGVIVRDGYAGYGHLTGALHAWCGARLLRDLKDVYDFEPGKQDWACRAGREPVPAHRHCEGRPPHRPPVPRPAAQLRRLLAHPRRARPLRDRPLLPIYRRQMGPQQTRRPPRPLQRSRIAPARPRTAG